MPPEIATIESGNSYHLRCAGQLPFSSSGADGGKGDHRPREFEVNAGQSSCGADDKSVV